MRKSYTFNPILPVTPKTRYHLTILVIFLKQMEFSENIWRRNVVQNPTQNPPSNILWIYVHFQTYVQKYQRSWRRLAVMEIPRHERVNDNPLSCSQDIRTKQWTLPMLRLLSPKHNYAKTFENHLNPLRWVPMCQGFSIFQVFCIILYWPN